MNNRSCALFRAANLRIMDYPFDAALASALSVCDEAVVVVGPSEDDTEAWVRELADEWPRRCVTVATMDFFYDRGWQERWWDYAASLTDADWLAYWDADEVIHEDDAADVRALLQREDLALISFPFIHFWMTARLHQTQFPPRATRIGRRSAGWRMVNWCTDDTPNHPACQMIFGDEGHSAHGYQGPEIEHTDIPIYHYSWCRDATALQISQMKHVDWYRNGERFGLVDGRVPDAEPYDFHKDLTSLRSDEYVVPYEGKHPAVMGPWLEDHEQQWVELEEACLSLA